MWQPRVGVGAEALKDQTRSHATLGLSHMVLFLLDMVQSEWKVLFTNQNVEDPQQDKQRLIVKFKRNCLPQNNIRMIIKLFYNMLKLLHNLKILFKKLHRNYWFKLFKTLQILQKNFFFKMNLKLRINVSYIFYQHCIKIGIQSGWVN